MKSAIIPVILFAWMAACAPPYRTPGTCIADSTLCEGVTLVSDQWDNITAILTEKGFIVIDAGISPSLTSKYRKIIEDRLGRKDFIYLFNTHSHPDHTAGNQVFTDAVIVAQENAAEAIRRNWLDTARVKARLMRTIDDYQVQLDTMEAGSAGWQEAGCIMGIYESAWRDVAEGRLKATFPTTTFRDTLTLRCGEVTVCCKFFGRAHSESDILIHIPEKGILFTGDLFSHYGRAYFSTGDTTDAAQWIAALDWVALRTPEIQTIVGGHGEILTKEDLTAFDQRIRHRSTGPENDH
jgi:glyoxylase-like metal-dependent hydrolase (beta-lactamase superfamily II)